MATTQITELRRALAQMRQCVESLRSSYGNIAAVKRLASDVERLSIDADELAELDSTPRQRQAPPPEGEVVVMSDAPYDASLWHEADDEGVGGVRHR